MNFEREILSRLKTNGGIYQERLLLNQFINLFIGRLNSKKVFEKFSSAVIRLIEKRKIRLPRVINGKRCIELK